MKEKILKLVNSVEFQELNSYYNEKTIFNALNVERNENRHSSFLAWWLNPKSEHGLGDSPLKLFLRLIATKTWGNSDGKDEAFYTRILTGNYDVEVVGDIEVEKNVGKICNRNSKDRIDIWSVLRLTYEEDGAEKQIIIPLVIENKIYSGEGQNQTQRYYKAASEYELVKEVEHHPICVLLTVEDKKAQSEHFYNITYQDMLTYVIEPLATSVAPDSMQFVESFIRNLGRPALTNNKYYGVLAVSQKEKAMLGRVVNNKEDNNSNKEIFNAAFALQHKPAEKIIGTNSQPQDISEVDKNILNMLWDANEVVFKAVIYHLYGQQHKALLDSLFKSTNRDTSKYNVWYRGNVMFQGKRLSKAMTACAIFQAYLKEYPSTTLAELQNAFPCKELNKYYYDRYYNDLFYEVCEKLRRTGGKDKDKDFLALAEWDFYLKAELLLPIEDDNRKAMCVKMWRKGDFDKLIEYVEEKYSEFIDIKECL